MAKTFDAIEPKRNPAIPLPDQIYGIGRKNSAGVDLGPLQTEQAITWSNDHITVIGEIIDGVFVVAPMSG